MDAVFASTTTSGQGSIRRGEGGEGGFGTQKFVYRKWPNPIFPMVSFVFFPLRGVQGVARVWFFGTIVFAVPMQ